MSGLGAQTFVEGGPHDVTDELVGHGVRSVQKRTRVNPKLRRSRSPSSRCRRTLAVLRRPTTTVDYRPEIIASTARAEATALATGGDAADACSRALSRAW